MLSRSVSSVAMRAGRPASTIDAYIRPESACKRFLYHVSAVGVLLLLLTSNNVDSLLSEPVFNTIPLQSYKAYESSNFLTYNVPNSAEKMTLVFGLLVQDHCPARRAIVYIRPGGFPVFSYQNDTFPPDFYNDDTDGPIELLHSTNDTAATIFTATSPEVGLWYIGAFLEGNHGKEVDSPQCTYVLWMLYDVILRPEIIDIGVLPQHLLLRGNGSVSMRIFIPKHVYRLDLHIGRGLMTTPGNASGDFDDASKKTCLLTVLSRQNGVLPMPDFDDKHVLSVSCTNGSDDCVLTVHGPAIDNWHHFVLRSDIPDSCLVTIQASIFACKSEGGRDASCIFHELKRGMNANIMSTNKFYPPEMHLSISTNPTFVAFQLSGDGGGTLHVTLSMSDLLDQTESMGIVSDAVNLTVCMKQGALPVTSTAISSSNDGKAYSRLFLSCSGSHTYKHLINAGSAKEGKDFYIPYPRGGWWYVGFEASRPSFVTSSKISTAEVDMDTALNDTNLILGESLYSLNRTNIIRNDLQQVEAEIRAPMDVVLTVRTSPCVDGGCGGHGTCSFFVKGSSALYLTTCSCSAGWRGYGCTDGSRGLSTGLQLAQKVILTLSNVGCLAAAILAVKWRWYSEAAIYFFAALSSTMYHMCDGSSVLNRCVLPFKYLQIMDFVGSLSSLWATLLTLAKIPSAARSALQIAGVFTLLSLTMNDPTSIWNIAVPLVAGLVIFVVSVVMECRVQRRCYPARRIWLVQLLPGSLFAAAAVVLFTVHTDPVHEYAYVHASWHVAAAVAIICILPRHRSITCLSSALRRIFKVRRWRCSRSRDRDFPENSRALAPIDSCVEA